MHSADEWEELLWSEIEQQQQGKEVVFRAGVAFAKPESYEALEERGVGSASGVGIDSWRKNPAKKVSEREVSVQRSESRHFRGCGAAVRKGRMAVFEVYWA